MTTSYRKSTELPALRSIEIRPDGQIVPCKIGEFGGQGCGKSLTALLIALGLSLNLHDGEPIFVYDTEPGWNLIEHVADIEGVRLIVEPGDTFEGLRRAHDRAISLGACVFAGDSYTHVWKSLTEKYMTKDGFVDFADWNVIKPEWREWSKQFLNSPLHCIACGRLSWNWENEKDERGRWKPIKSDSKFNAGGGESFGYEPNLLLELEQVRQGAHGGRGGQIAHRMTVLKDRLMALNGETFIFETLRDYKKGDYRYVWNAIAPHVQAMQRIKSRVLIPNGTKVGSGHTFTGKSTWQKEQDIRRSFIEDWDATMELMFGGSTQAAKRLRMLVGEAITRTRSRSRMENDLTTAQLEACVLTLFAVEERIKILGKDAPSDEMGILNLVDAAKQQVEESTKEDDAFDRGRGVEQFFRRPVQREESPDLTGVLTASIEKVKKEKQQVAGD